MGHFASQLVFNLTPQKLQALLNERWFFWWQVWLYSYYCAWQRFACDFLVFDLSTCFSCVLVSGLHLVVLPKLDDPSKAVLSTCTEAELIKLAAKDIYQGQYSTINASYLPPPSFYLHCRRPHLPVFYYTLSFLILCACLEWEAVRGVGFVLKRKDAQLPVTVSF